MAVLLGVSNVPLGVPFVVVARIFLLAEYVWRLQVKLFKLLMRVNQTIDVEHVIGWSVGLVHLLLAPVALCLQVWLLV